MSDAFSAAEGGRRTNNGVMMGVIESIDRDAGTVRVQFEEDWTSADLPWVEAGAGGFRTRHDPSVGEQVMVACPGGDPAQGVVMGRLSRTASPLPDAAESETVIGLWSDGARDSYDADTHTRTIDVPAGGRIVLKVGASELVITEDSILLKSDAVDLGDEGGQPIGRVNDAISTSTSKIVAGSPKVKAV